MVCTSADIKITPPEIPASGNKAPFTIPAPKQFPEVGVPDLGNLFNIFSLAVPSGNFKPNLSPQYTKNIQDTVLSLFSQFTPFLMLFKFLLPVLNIINCVIEILCAIPNPFSMIRAVRRLFRRCLPDFLSLFPIFSFFVILLSILVLLLQIIEFLIQQLKNIVNRILQNIELLAKAKDRSDYLVMQTITKKISFLLCDFQNILLILSTFALIFDVINQVLQTAGKIPPCDSSDVDGCCVTEVCPDFLRNNITVSRSTGTLKYLNRVYYDANVSLPVGFNPYTQDLRIETWQFFDGYAPQNLALYNITHPYDLDPAISKSFFPEGVTYTSDSRPEEVPYTVDLKLFYDPSLYGRTDSLGARYVLVKNCILSTLPTDGYYNYDNSVSSQPSGVTRLVGGLAYESDGYVPLYIDGVQVNLEQLIHFAPKYSISPAPSPTLDPNDGYVYQNVEYTLNIHHDVLLKYGFIVLGCVPDVKLDRDFVNSVFKNNLGISQDLANNLTNILPNLNQTNVCIQNAYNKYISEVSLESTAIFQAEVNSCLNDANQKAVNSFAEICKVAFDPNKSSFSINPTVQFTTSQIKLTVNLKDTNGNSIIDNLPTDASNSIAQILNADVTLGSVGNFIYENNTFVNYISSATKGNGKVKVSFNNNYISTLSLPTDLTQSPTVTITELDYEFIDASFVNDGKPRRDESDSANDANVTVG